MSENKAPTRVDYMKSWLSNNKYFAVLIIAGVIIIAIGSVVNSVFDIKNALFGEEKTEEDKLADEIKKLSAENSIQFIAKPFIIRPITNKDLKISTFKIDQTNPAVSLKFVALKSDLLLTFKVSKKLKCSDLCDAIVNHFELLNTITLGNAALKIKPTLVVNKKYVISEQTLEEQGLQDGDVINISYDYTGSEFATAKPFIWNDSIVYTQGQLAREASFEFLPFKKYGNFWEKNESVIAIDEGIKVSRPAKIMVMGNEFQNVLGVF